MVGGEHSLKSSAPYLLRSGCNDVLKVWRKRMSELINHKAVCRTVPVTPGLLNKMNERGFLRAGRSAPRDLQRAQQCNNEVYIGRDTLFS